MTREHLTKFAEASLERADKALRSAKRLLEEFPEDAVSRAYYAMFHAARAILHVKGIKAKTHGAVISMFGKEIAEKGIVDKELGRILNRAFDLRQKSDYEIDVEIKSGDVEEIVKDAERFIKMVKHSLRPKDN